MIQRTLCPILVGREEELSTLEDALLEAARGAGTVIVLGGAAGLGKTRLALELRARAEKIGSTVLWGSCAEADLALPYLPFVEALGNHLATTDIGKMRERLGASARVLAALFPVLGRVPARADGGDPAQARLRLFEGLVALLRAVAERRPVLLVLEDMHWADTSTRDLLDFVARRLAGMPIAVLVTYRHEETGRGHPLLVLIQSWRRARLAESVQLERLTSEQVGAMVMAIFDQDEVSTEFRDHLHRRTEGSPFVLEELLKEAVDSGDVFRTADGWDRKAIAELRIPQAVSDAILMRIARLAPQQVALLQAAAVLGHAFSYTTLAAVADLHGADPLPALETCVGEQLLDRDREAAERYRFRHAITAEVVYEDLLAPRRLELHRRAARTLRDAGAPNAEVARHLVLAGSAGEAVPLYVAAAAEAMSRNAAAEAVDLYRRALTHVTDDADGGLVTSRLGEALWRSGDLTEAEPCLDAAIAVLERHDEPVLAAHARLLRARCAWERGRVAESWEQYETVRRILEPLGPSEDLAMVYLRLAHLHCMESKVTPATELARRTIDVAVAAGCDWLRIWGHTYLGMAMCQLGDVDEGIRTVDYSVDEAAAREYFWIARSACLNGVNLRMYALRSAEIPAQLAKLRAMPGISLLDEVWALGFESQFHFARGDLSECLACIDAAAELSRKTGQGTAAVNLGVARAWVHLERDDVEAARAVAPLPEQYENPEDQRDARWVQTALALATGEIDAAGAIARGVLVSDGHTVAPWLSEVAVEAFLASDDRGDARRVLDAADQFGEPGREPFHRRALGRVAFSQGDVPDAVRSFEAATRIFHDAEDTVQELRTRLVLARALAACGAVDEAQAQLLTVAETADARSLTRLAREARELASELRVALPPPPPAADEPTAAPDATPPPVMHPTERLVTVMFADVRGYTELTARTPPSELAGRIATLQRWAGREVVRQHGIVDKFAGDAVMATFNVSGRTLDHCRGAVEAGIALCDKAALLDLGLGVGIAVGPAVVGTLAEGANLSVLGEATNLASRLQAAAGPGEILLAEEAYRRVRSWFEERRITTTPRRLRLKGLHSPITAYSVHRVLPDRLPSA